MRKSVLLFFSSALILGTSGCMVILMHDPEVVCLCDVAELNGWEQGNDGREVHKKIGDFTYMFRVFDIGSGNKARWALPGRHPNGDNEVLGPVSGVYWVQLWGLGNAPQGVLGPINLRSLKYNPSDAFLTIGDRTYRALPRVWRGSFAPKVEVSTPVDLDARKQMGSANDAVFIAFPTQSPSPRDVYSFSPGSIVLDGVQTPLPVFKSCHTDGKTYWMGIR